MRRKGKRARLQRPGRAGSSSYSQSRGQHPLASNKSQQPGSQATEDHDADAGRHNPEHMGALSTKRYANARARWCVGRPSKRRHYEEPGNGRDVYGSSIGGLAEIERSTSRPFPGFHPVSSGEKRELVAFQARYRSSSGVLLSLAA